MLDVCVKDDLDKKRMKLIVININNSIESLHLIAQLIMKGCSGAMECQAGVDMFLTSVYQWWVTKKA